MYQPPHHTQGALLVRLDRKAEGVVSGGDLACEYPIDQLQRQLQAVGFLRIDGEANAGGTRLPDQFQQARTQLAQYPLALQILVTRMQRRELDRDTRRGN